MGFSLVLRNALLDLVFGGASFSSPTNLYIGLSTADPGPDGSGISEPSVGSYARVEVSNDLTNWESASDGTKINKTAIQFPTATGSWGIIGWVTILDAPTGGNFIAGGALSEVKNIGLNDTPSFSAGDLVITQD